MFKKIESGKSVKGVEIPAYINVDDAKDYTYLIAGVHGDEGEGIFVMEQLHAWLMLEDPSTPIIMVPLVNPDGFAADTRVNANGVDLNRNWPVGNWTPTFDDPRYNPGPEPLSEPENIFLCKLFKKYRPSMIFTFHSWKPLLNYNPQAKPIAEYIAEFNQYEITEEIGYPTPGSLGTYASEVLQCGIITYECPKVSANIGLTKVWQENEHGLMKYFTEYK